MPKQTLKVVGNVTKDVTVDRIMSFLKQDAESMLGRTASDDTKTVTIEIMVKELKGVR